MLGEDIAAAGGVFKTTVGLLDEFGPDRIRDTPISEQAILGAAMGAAMTGVPTIAEIMFSDFLAVCWDMIANEIAKSRYMTNGQVSFPLVVRTANGGGSRFGAQHSQSVENWAMMIPGLKVVAPSTPEDVVGLMAASIRDPDPVIFFEHKSLMATKAEVPDGEIVDQLGTARVVREGTDVTIAALALMVPRALEAAEPPRSRGDLRRGHRRALARAARHEDAPRIGDQDRPILHGRGEPPAVRLGRGDRLDRRRGGLLGPRRPVRSHHDTAHPVAVRRLPRGSGYAVGRPHPRDDRAFGRREERTVSTAFLLQGACVLTLGARTQNHAEADVLIEDAVITEVGSGLRSRSAEVIDASNTIVMPGFVDAHRRCWPSLFKNEGSVTSHRDPSPDDVYAGTLVSLLGAAEAGVTTVVDWYDGPSGAPHIDAALRAHEESGVRTVLVIAPISDPVDIWQSTVDRYGIAPSPTTSLAAGIRSVAADDSDYIGRVLERGARARIASPHAGGPLQRGDSVPLHGPVCSVRIRPCARYRPR